jgi:hypothetical protein
MIFTKLGENAKALAFGGFIVAVAAATYVRAADAPSTSPVAAQAFRNSADTAPPDWNGPRFTLSHNYPKKMPDCNAAWLKRKVSFSDPNPEWNDWKGYIQDMVDYVKEGQDPNLTDEAGWKSAVKNETRWYHVPWMAYDGQRGREFVHGLTNELSTALSTFHEGRGSGKEHLMGAVAANGEDPLFETWSVGMYNGCGAWSVGQAFPASGAPAVYNEGSRMFAKGLPFPEGTLVVKVLNTTADESSVPYLKGTTTWQANGHVQFSPTTYSTCQRRPRKVHLVQVDLAVVDSRSPTRWVYSTLAYNGFLTGATVWDRLEPLGVQFGNDPQTFPAVARPSSKPLSNTVHAPIPPTLPQHYGCEKRLAGAVDQANSSCVSCHMGAYSAAPGVLEVQGGNIPAIFSFDGLCTTFNPANHAYFSNYKYPAPYPNDNPKDPNAFENAIPLDSSLQLAVAFAQYAVYKNPGAVTPTCPDSTPIHRSMVARSGPPSEQDRTKSK